MVILGDGGPFRKLGHWGGPLKEILGFQLLPISTFAPAMIYCAVKAAWSTDHELKPLKPK
jgi:hypothetical protein